MSKRPAATTIGRTSPRQTRREYRVSAPPGGLGRVGSGGHGVTTPEEVTATVAPRVFGLRHMRGRGVGTRDFKRGRPRPPWSGPPGRRGAYVGTCGARRAEGGQRAGHPSSGSLAFRPLLYAGLLFGQLPRAELNLRTELTWTELMCALRPKLPVK